MKRQFGPVSLTIMGVAVLLALIQWIVGWQGNTLSSAVEFVQTWILITASVVLVTYLALRESSGFADLVRRFFTLRSNLPIPVTILSYLSTEWFLGFHEKYNVAAWHSGVALKGFWLGTIAQSHPSATNPFPNVHYSFWVNLLQWMVDHSVYSWFGYVVIGGELLVAATFITAIVSVVSRSMLLITVAGTVVALLFHFWFLMSGSAGVNALMPYLTAIATVCLIGSWVTTSLPKTPVEVVEGPSLSTLHTIAVPREKVSTNGARRDPVTTR
jgi:hypothetical protein